MPNALKFIVLTVCAAFVLTGCAMYRPTGAYGLYVENSFLSSCEMRARVPYCSCMLGFLEQNASEQQAMSDFAGGVIPAWAQTGVNECQWAVL
jgi:hypothetical protein